LEQAYVAEREQARRLAVLEERQWLARYRLPELLQQLRDSLVGRLGIAMTLDLDCDPELPQETMRNLYRITQEALNNVVRHANATTVLVHLACARKPSPLR
jgi:signal transduction histidine kinase